MAGVFLEIAQIHLEGQSAVAKVVEAKGLFALFFGSGQGGEEHAREDRDNGDHDQQLDQREGAAAWFGSGEKGRVHNR